VKLPSGQVRGLKEGERLKRKKRREF